MMPKKRGSMLLALGVDPKGEEELDEDEAEIDVGEDMGLAAAEDAIRAMKRGDAEALNDALKRHYESCVAGGGGAEEASDEDFEDEEY